MTSVIFYLALLATLLSLLAPLAFAQEAGRECNMPITGTFQSVTIKAVGSATSLTTPYQVQLASTSAVTDNYYVGSTIAITGGPGVGASTRITAYCGLSHTSCEGMDSSGTIQAVTFDQKEMTLTNTLQTRGGYPSSLVNVASILKVRLPSVDGSGKSVAAGGAAVTTCATAVVPPYMNSYTGADCTGTYVGRNIYISRGTGSGQVGLIRAGPDANRDVLVTGLLGYCSGGLDSLACLDDWHYGEQNCQANMGSRCVHDGDCTGGPNARCVAPVDTTSEYTISHSPISSTCNPLCNGVASYTATVDLATTFTLTSSSTYSISRGCYDERFGTGMRRLGSSGTGAGQQRVALDWKVLVTDEVVARPSITADGSVIVGSVKGSLTKVGASGAKMWNIYVGSVIGNPAIGADGTIYFGSGDRNIWAVTDSGVTRWRYPTPLPVQASPLVTEDAVYIGDRNGTFYRFNLDGSIKWRVYTQGEIWGGAKMTRDGKVVFGSMDTYFYCLDSATGGQLWKYSVGQEIVGTPLIQDVSIVYGTREDEENYGQVIALKMDGSVRWTYDATSSIESEPAEGPNGVVYVATVDGKLLAIQADGSLLWKYNTGGTGGVCTRRYGADQVSIGTTVTDGDSNVGEFKTVGEDTTVILGSTASTVDDYYKSYRATFKIGEGTLVKGQFRAVKEATVAYVPVSTTTIHDTYFTDSSDVDVAFAVSFTVMDTMIAGESFSLALSGITTVGTVADLLLNPAPGLVGIVSPGAIAFSGATGTATAGTGTTMTLATGGCGSDDLCRGATITFVTGKGAGQTATITKYVHSTLVATISYVGVPADATTTYSISQYRVPRFKAAYANANNDGAAGIITFTVINSVGLADCGTGCSNTVIKLAATTPGTTHSATAGFHNGHVIEFTDGTGAGQISTCLTYTVAVCVMDFVNIKPDGTTTYKIGPQVLAGEKIVLATAYGTIKYPHYSGVNTAGSASTVTLAATANTDLDIYAGMMIEMRYVTATPCALDATTVTSLDDTSIVVNAADAVLTCRYFVGAYLKVAGSSEFMEIVSITANTPAAGKSTIVVRRAALGSSETIYTGTPFITLFAYSTVSGYVPSSRVLSFAALTLGPNNGDTYRLMGTSAQFEFLNAARGNFASVHSGVVKLSSAPEYNVATVTLIDESAITGLTYVGATITVVWGRGSPLVGKITAHNFANGVVSVAWQGDADEGPKGTSDAGYTTSGYRLSFYEITAQGTVTGYVGATKTLTTEDVGSSVRYQAKLCTTYSSGAQGKRECSANAEGAARVTIDWAGGAWCEAGGGRGWGATSPCVANGLVVTTSSNKFIYGLSTEGTVQFKYMTGKRIKAPPRCTLNADKTLTIYSGSSDHYLYRLTADAPKVLRGSSWYSE